MRVCLGVYGFRVCVNVCACLLAFAFLRVHEFVTVCSCAFLGVRD